MSRVGSSGFYVEILHESEFKFDVYGSFRNYISKLQKKAKSSIVASVS